MNFVYRYWKKNTFETKKTLGQYAENGGERVESARYHWLRETETTKTRKLYIWQATSSRGLSFIKLGTSPSTENAIALLF